MQCCCCLVAQSCPTLVAHQAPLSMGFPKQAYWSGLSFPSPGDLPNLGIEPATPALVGGFFTTEPPGKPKTVLQQERLQPDIRRLPLQWTGLLEKMSSLRWLCFFSIWRKRNEWNEVTRYIFNQPTDSGRELVDQLWGSMPGKIRDLERFPAFQGSIILLGRKPRPHVR